MHLVHAEFQIFDYTNSQLITLKDDTARVQEGTFKIIHVINLEEYAKLTNQIENTIRNNINSTHQLYPFLIHEISQVRTLIAKISPKTKEKRSLDFIGSAWKWVAGNPDHRDLEIINENLKTLNENNDNQIIINKQMIEKLNEQNERSNRIMKIINIDNKLEISLRVKYQIQLIKEELLNIEYALHWAKSSVVNSFILSSIEIETLEKIVKHEGIPYINVEEELEFTDVSIAANGSMIIYILSLPTTGKEECEILTLKSVKSNNKINKIEYDKILNCNKKIFGIRSKCKEYNRKAICNANNLVELSENNCISKLIRSQLPNCTRTNADHISDVEEIYPGILLLNNFNGTIEIDGQQLTLTGTFIIKHHNSTIKIEDKIFYIREEIYFEPLPAIFQQQSKKAEIEETLSLEMIKELEIINRKRISKIDTNNKIGLTLNSITLAAFATLTVILTYALWKIKKKTPTKGSTILEAKVMPTGTFAFEKGGVNIAKANAILQTDVHTV